MMSRKHYQAIAEAIGRNMSEPAPNSEDTYCDAEQLIVDLCYIFEADNAYFDPVRFRRAVKESGVYAN